VELFVGIDGGGTKTNAVAMNAGGEVLARVEGGAALIRPEDPGAGAGLLADLTERAVRAAGGSLPAAGLCCALAGAGREPVRRALAAELHREGVAVRLRIVTDAEAAFYDAFADGPGILLIAGTGSIVWGRAEDGRTARAGGWGAILGDEGSGYALGLGALRAVVRAHDGRGEATSLAPAVLAHAGVDAPESLVAWAAGASKREIAALAPAVASAAGAGDAVARRIVEEAAGELVAHVVALHHRLGPWKTAPGLALSGGLIAPGGPLRAAVVEALQVRGPECALAERQVDAARGAASLARLPAIPAAG
jgi:glucosamine kinase